MAIDKEVLDQLLAAELDDHLESEAEAGGANRRNGTSRKTMSTGSSTVSLDIPRDHPETFDPKLIARYQRRFPDFDDSAPDQE